MVNQLALNLRRIQGLGVKKLVVSGLQPLGCLPQSTFISSFQQCNGTQNSLVNFHNLLLQQTVAKLNNETKDSKIVILDLYGAFMTVLNNKGNICLICDLIIYLFMVVNILTSYLLMQEAQSLEIH